MPRDRKTGNRMTKRPEQEFEQKIIDLARVTRVMAGGKRMRFRACVAIGDKSGRVGFGIAKGADVTLAVNKAVNKAKKKMVEVPLTRETIPHVIRVKYGAAELLLKPAPRGTGIKAGGPVRVIMELAGVPNVVAKILGTNNKLNNVRALFAAFESFKPEAIKISARSGIKDKKIKKEEKSVKDVIMESVEQEIPEKKNNEVL